MVVHCLPSTCLLRRFNVVFWCLGENAALFKRLMKIPLNIHQYCIMALIFIIWGRATCILANQNQAFRSRTWFLSNFKHNFMQITRPCSTEMLLWWQLCYDYNYHNNSQNPTSWLAEFLSSEQLFMKWGPVVWSFCDAYKHISRHLHIYT